MDRASSPRDAGKPPIASRDIFGTHPPRQGPGHPPDASRPRWCFASSNCQPQSTSPLPLHLSYASDTPSPAADLPIVIGRCHPAGESHGSLEGHISAKTRCDHFTTLLPGHLMVVLSQLALNHVTGASHTDDAAKRASSDIIHPIDWTCPATQPCLSGVGVGQMFGRDAGTNTAAPAES